MASKVDIWNAALTAIGRQIIASETEDSTRANLVRSRYDNLRQKILEDVWTFATSRVRLARLVDVPVFGWKYFYAMPANHLTTLGVFFDADLKREALYQIEGDNRLATDNEEIYMRYIEDVEDPNRMTASFREYLSAELAFQICIRSTELSGRRKDMESWRNDAKIDARSKDAQGDLIEQIPEGSWISGRYGSHTDGNDWSW